MSSADPVSLAPVSELTTDQKGAIAESAIAHAAIKLSIDVYKPIQEGGRYDLILNVGSQLLRVQCKWAPRHGDVVVVRCRSCRRTRDGLRHRAYTAAEVDVIAAYCPDVDRCYVVPAARFDGRLQLFLRLAPSRNNQVMHVNWAKDFDFEARLTALQGP
jgi:PD-(D/E)XK nuclease superfamily protein